MQGMYRWRIQGRGSGGAPPLFLDQNETRRADKLFFFLRPPPPLSPGLNDCPPPPHSFYLKVWIRHCVREKENLKESVLKIIIT